MTNDLDKLEDKIDQAREKTEEPSENDESKKRGMRAGSEFLGAVCGFAVMGYGIDYYFGTKPWAMLAFIILGFVAGVYTASRTMNKDT